MSTEASLARMDTADTTSLKLSQNALLKALVGDLVCMYDVNVRPVFRRMVGHWLMILTYSIDSRSLIASSTSALLYFLPFISIVFLCQ